MKNIQKLFASLSILTVLASCTPQELINSPSQNTDKHSSSQYFDKQATGGETQGGTDDNRDPNGD